MDAVQVILQAHAQLADANVLQHRVLSLSDEAQELPAISITFGDDATIDEDGASNFAFIDSLQTLVFRIVVEAAAGDEEEHAISALQDLRRGIHMALMADRSQGLAWVIDTRYGGADPPVISRESERLCGSLDCRLTVHYRMNIADPA